MKSLAGLLCVIILSLGVVNVFAGDSFISYTQIQHNSLYHQSI